MKKSIIITSLIISLGALPLYAQESNDKPFTVGRALATGLLSIDASQTTYGIVSPYYDETNPVVKPFAKNPIVYATLAATVITTNYYLLGKLHNKNPKLARVIAWGISGIETFVVSYNFKVFSRPVVK